MAYTVSWDAVAADADTNRGVSALHVSALDVANGTVLWQVMLAKITALYQSSLQQMVDGVLYIAGISSQSSLVLAVDTRDGHAIWQHTEQQGGVSMLTVCGGKVYLRTGAAQITALQSSTGKRLWSYGEKNVVMSFVSNPVVTMQAVYLMEQQPTSSGSISLAVLALGMYDGKVVWRTSYGTQQGRQLTLVANGSAVYVINQVPSQPSQDPFVPIASVQALDGESGKVLWEARMPPNMEQIYVLRVGDTLYLNGQYLLDRNQYLLVALQASNGKRLWLRKHSYNQISVLDGQDLYGYTGYDPSSYPQGKKLLCWLDGMTGKDRWCVDSLQPSLFSLSATDAVVIVQEVLQPDPLTLVQNLYGVSKQDGTIMWKLPWKSSSASVQTLTLVTIVGNQSFQGFMNL
ncbi:MAG: PQQ-binding-like beta-propeller repeat protein [Ktedonobacterales bacterium]